MHSRSSRSRQTYYLTLELSYAEFKGHPPKAHHHSRGGYYKNWLDGASGKANDSTGAAPLPNESNNENDPPMPDPEIDDLMRNVDPALRDKGKEVVREELSPEAEREEQSPDMDREGQSPEIVPGPEQEKETDKDEAEQDDIRVLELHSDNPIISYRGRVFEGQWAEVIGTELIMANHDVDNPIPALRNLADGVDILAAASSRILTKEKILKPKVPDVDMLAPIREEWNIRVPGGRDRTGERGQQTRFLENLMALKKKRGEEDHVTVYTKEGTGKDFQDNKDPDFKPRRRRPPIQGDGVSGPGRRRRGGRIGRPRGTRARGRARARSHAGGDVTATESVASPLSTPTPSRWDDLSRDYSDDEDAASESGASHSGDDEDVEDDEDEGEDEEDDDDVAMAD